MMIDTCRKCSGPLLLRGKTSETSRRYGVCSRCRHGALVPCPACGRLMRPSSGQCRACRLGDASIVGENHPAWKGGRVQIAHGYIRAYAPDHPRAVNGRYVLEHVLVMEKRLGRYLFPDERVHHMNRITNDNRDENLELWTVGHPAGARVQDAVTWAREILRRYEEK